MSNLSEMPAQSSDPSNSHKQTAEERKKEAQELFTRIKGSAAPMQSRSSLEIGYCAYLMQKKNLFGMLGFDEEQTRDAAGVGRSTWYNTIAIAKAFDGLPEELFTTMKLVNAQAAVDLPSSKRLDREW